MLDRSGTARYLGCCDSPIRLATPIQVSCPFRHGRGEGGGWEWELGLKNGLRGVCHVIGHQWLFGDMTGSTDLGRCHQTHYKHYEIRKALTTSANWVELNFGRKFHSAHVECISTPKWHFLSSKLLERVPHACYLINLIIIAEHMLFYGM